MFDFASLKDWPQGAEFRTFRPLATVVSKPLTARQRIDQAAIWNADRVHRRRKAIQCSGMTQGYAEVFYNNLADFSAMSNTTSETSLLSGTNRQPAIPAFVFDQGVRGPGKTFKIEAQGVLSTTSTPTIILQCRLGTTVGATFLSGTSVGVTAAITTQSGVTNKFWRMELLLTCYTAGQGSGNTTLSGAGYVMSPGGFASPFFYPLEPTTPDTATWTSTIDLTATQFFNLSGTWSAASSSNSITCKNLVGYCIN